MVHTQWLVLWAEDRLRVFNIGNPKDSEMMLMVKLGILGMVISLCMVNSAFAGTTWATGLVTSLMASAMSPAIRLTGNITPDNCDGGSHGWIYFNGTPEEQHRVYATALAMSLSGKTITVYTNGNGAQCKIINIQITSGLN
ncbi:hypothetical protein [Shewanella psychropiezotolerans]|uniref:hypothetical protein n=1 Tax=Shewanella psychropiezotolerans TaxID=2593655 RepID=UPI00163D8BC3|nr:hypothetical protein [Shewanella psychropiezotolerans]